MTTLADPLRAFVWNDGVPIPDDHRAWFIAKLKITLTTAWFMLWNRVARRRVVAPGSGVDVSLTTYGPRTAGSYLTIESIGLGRTRPERLILWIDEHDVIIEPPAPLRRLMRRGLEIRLCDDVGPHKKWYPYTQQLGHENTRRMLVTADDDVFYPRWWLRRLLDSYATSPGDVVAYRAWRIIEGHPYVTWPLCSSTTSSYDHFATGVSGVLYDQTMVELLRRSGKAFTEVCPRADDVWLHRVAVSSGIGVRQVAERAVEFWPRLQTTEHALAHTNTVGGGNDVAFVATARLFAEVADENNRIEIQADMNSPSERDWSGILTREPDAGNDEGADCPECGHSGGSERVTRGGKLRGPKVLRCCHVTTQQDALVDDWEMCHCANAWHQPQT
ncbi:glycosyltransferase [Gordonia phage Mcklovin]|uniref:Glycosyltransferase n=1 Tax=Gordonia phage Mcklovin TaxID=2652881 RepID=A0A5P8DCX7_9CAUD|nr:glycosyltransferase [Gordonia phage Mcklovin]QFP96815.1 glycosyltransferase [Gordonia phage Mcklovin]